MRRKLMKIVFVASIIRHNSCMIYAFLFFFVQKSFLTKNYFLTAEINLTTRGPLYTCLVLFVNIIMLIYSMTIVIQHSERLEIFTRCVLWVQLFEEVKQLSQIFFHQEGLIIARHDLCVFSLFLEKSSTFRTEILHRL